MKLRLTFLWICSVHCPSAVSNTYRTSWDCPDAIETTNSAKPGPLQLYNSFRLILHEFGHVWALGKDQHDGILLHCEDKQSPWIRCFSKANIANGHLVWVGLSSSNCDFKTFRTNFEFFALLAEQNPAKSGKHLSSETSDWKKHCGKSSPRHRTQFTRRHAIKALWSSGFMLIQEATVSICIILRSRHNLLQWSNGHIPHIYPEKFPKTLNSHGLRHPHCEWPAHLLAMFLTFSRLQWLAEKTWIEDLVKASSGVIKDQACSTHHQPLAANNSKTIGQPKSKRIFKWTKWLQYRSFRNNQGKGWAKECRKL